MSGQAEWCIALLLLKFGCQHERGEIYLSSGALNSTRAVGRGTTCPICNHTYHKDFIPIYRVDVVSFLEWLIATIKLPFAVDLKIQYHYCWCAVNIGRRLFLINCHLPCLEPMLMLYSCPWRHRVSSRFRIWLMALSGLSVVNPLWLLCQTMMFPRLMPPLARQSTKWTSIGWEWVYIPKQGYLFVLQKFPYRK